MIHYSLDASGKRSFAQLCAALRKKKGCDHKRTQAFILWRIVIAINYSPVLTPDSPESVKL